MNRRKLLASLPLTTLTVACLPAAAQDEAAAEKKHPIDQKIDALAEKDPSTAGMVQAYAEGEKLWDAERNKVYKEFLGRLDDAGKALLKTSQKAWLALRDAQKALIDSCFSHYEGTMFVPIAAAAHMEVIRARTLDLAHRSAMHEENAAS
jgi:uncharacterized protein YecT (DUF1311 family)